jgi:hypothetical protein
VSGRIDELIPELRPFARDLVRAAAAAGLLPRITSTRRTYAEQKRLYDRYLAGASEYPAAPPGHSAHEYGYAFDMIVSPLEALADVGAYWEAEGGIWGGRIGDDVHFEFPGFQAAYGADIRTAQALDDATDITRPLETVGNIAIGIELPLIGTIGTFADLARLFPWLSQSTLLEVASNPSKYIDALAASIFGPPPPWAKKLLNIR